MQTKYEQDCELLEKYKKLIQKYKVENPEKMQEYKQKLEFCQKKKQKLQLAIDALEHEQRNFEKCIKTLERIQDTTGRGMEAEQNQRENKTKIETMIEEKREKERQIKSKKRVKDNRCKNGILSSQVRTISQILYACLPPDISFHMTGQYLDRIFPV